MDYPKMIIFDYGHTLLYEPDWDSVRGNAELLKYATKNPNNYTLEDIRKVAELIFGKLKISAKLDMIFAVKLEIKCYMNIWE